MIKLLVLSVLVIFFNFLFYHSIGMLTIALVFSAFFFFFKFVLGGIKFKKIDLIILAVLTVLNIILLLRADLLVIFIVFNSLIFLLFSYVYFLMYGISIFTSWLEGVTTPFYIAKNYIISASEALFFSQSIKEKFGGNFNGRIQVLKTIARGLLLAIPVLFVLISILAAADPVYQKFVSNIFSVDFSLELKQRFIASLMLLLIFLPFVFYKAIKYSAVTPVFFTRLSLVTEMTVVMFLIAVTLASFILVQFKYIFVNVASEVSLADFGVKTYSEYVRRGFMELIIAAVFVYSTVTFGLIAWRNGKSGNIRLLKVIQLVVLSELLIFIFSLFRRVWLYQLYHGLSIVRVYGVIFLVFLTFMTLTLALRHVVRRKWVNVELSFMLAVILFCGFFNVENFIATSGHPPTVNNNVDYVYLSRMSPDGYEGWKKAYEYAGKILLNDNLLQKKIINKEERREISYAGIIASEIFRNYHYLMKTYGTEEEYKSFVKTLIEREMDQGTTGDEQAHFKKIKDKIDSNQAGLINLYVYVMEPRLDFINSALYIHFYNVTLIDNLEYKRIDRSLDIVYAYNFSNKSAFKNMQEDFQLNELIKLQERYFLFAMKVASQPESERSFEFDISMRSPLVD